MQSIVYCCPIVYGVFSVWILFCNTILSVLSSFAISLMSKIELAALRRGLVCSMYFLSIHTYLFGMSICWERYI